jgi:hypothetical protein
MRIVCVGKFLKLEANVEALAKAGNSSTTVQLLTNAK